MGTAEGQRQVGSGVPALPWSVRLYGQYGDYQGRVRLYGQYGDYQGHAFVTADPKGLARSVCDGFIDDMDWIVCIHNAVIAEGWRARLARRLLRLPESEGQ